MPCDYASDLGSAQLARPCAGVSRVGKRVLAIANFLCEFFCEVNERERKPQKWRGYRSSQPS
jgi:hypothetical protein